MPRNSLVKPCRPRRAAVIAAISVTLLAAACGSAHGQSNVANTTQTPTQSPTPKPTYQPAGVDGDWKLIFDDEFNGTQLDTKKWSTGWLASGITGPVNSFEKECYGPAQVTVTGRALNLDLITQSVPFCIHDPEDASRIVNTNGKVCASYGFLHARF